MSVPSSAASPIVDLTTVEHNVGVQSLNDANPVYVLRIEFWIVLLDADNVIYALEIRRPSGNTLLIYVKALGFGF
jgi:hypothetical protein